MMRCAHDHLTLELPGLPMPRYLNRPKREISHFECVRCGQAFGDAIDAFEDAAPYECPDCGGDVIAVYEPREGEV